MNVLIQPRAPRVVGRTLAAVRRVLRLTRPRVRTDVRAVATDRSRARPGDTSDAPDHEVICRLADIPDGGVIGIDLPHPLGLPLVLRRTGSQVRAWLNVCPQDGHRMDWAPGLFHVDGAVLRCANRGARFDLDRDGVCVEGPCRGRWLITVPVRVDDGVVVLHEAPKATER